MAKCLIGLGSNLGDRGANLQAALDRLRALPQAMLIAQSTFRDTNPAGGPAQDPYLNAAATIETSLTPQQLLAELLQIENGLGRVRTEHWGPRTIDLDLLLYDRLELNFPELTLPHPRMSFRRFVLEPAAEIAAEMVYPINGWTIRWLLARSNESSRLIALAPATTVSNDSSAATELLTSLVGVDQVIAQFHSAPKLYSPENTRSLRRHNCRHPPSDAEAGLEQKKWIIQDFWNSEWRTEHKNQPLPYVAGESQDERLAVVWLGQKPANLQLLDQARRDVRTGPVLWIPFVTLEQARQEVIAAMAAME